MEKVNYSIGSSLTREDFNAEFISNNNVQWAEMIYNHDERESVLIIYLNGKVEISFYVSDLIESLVSAKKQLELFEADRG